MTNSLHLVLRAADAAARWHADQRRKGSAAEPYINHLLEVAMLVAEATDGRNPALVAAALLHDAIEDQKIPPDTIAQEFGAQVAAIVVEVTDDKSLDKLERKRLQVINAYKKSNPAKILKLADKISNLRALAVSPPSDWPIERRLAYVRWARDVAVGLKGISPRLEAEFECAAAAAERAP
jgi:(p)ppGpp synthase/HD superfamily hydrolase